MLGDLKCHSQSINNIIILLAKKYRLNLQSVETIETIERFRTFGKHHSTVEKYMEIRNQNWMVYRDRWERLRIAERWD
jgi:hypothetical protein